MTSDQPDAHSTCSVTLQKMMAEQVQPDTFNPPHHKLRPSIKAKLTALLKEYTSQYLQKMRHAHRDNSTHKNDH